jgi:hypothetical protein
MSATSAAVLLGIYCISNQPVTGSIMVIDTMVLNLFFFAAYLLYGPIKSTHSVSHGLDSASLAGSLPCLMVVSFAFWHVLHF